MKKIITFILLLSCSSSIFVMDEDPGNAEEQQQLSNIFHSVNLKLDELHSHSKQSLIASFNRQVALQELEEKSEELLPGSEEFEKSTQELKLETSKNTIFLTSSLAALSFILLYNNLKNK